MPLWIPPLYSSNSVKGVLLHSAMPVGAMPEASRPQPAPLQVPSASVPWLQGRKGVWALKGTQSQSSRFASRVMVAWGIHLHGQAEGLRRGPGLGCSL